MSKARNWLEEENARNPVKERPIEKMESADIATAHGESDLREAFPPGKPERNKKRDALLASLRAGATIVAACRAADVGESTYYDWRDADREFRRQSDAARETASEVVADAVHRMATGSGGGKPNIVAAIFWLCNRDPKHWRHVNRVEVTGSNGQDLTVVLRGMAAKERELVKRWGGGGNGDGVGN